MNPSTPWAGRHGAAITLSNDVAETFRPARGGGIIGRTDDPGPGRGPGRATLIDMNHTVEDSMANVVDRVCEPSGPSVFPPGAINGQGILRVRRPDR